MIIKVCDLSILEIGMFLLAVSALCYTFGILFLFRRSFILMANVNTLIIKLLFLLGLYFFIGITGIIKFFTKKGKLQGSFVYFGGLVVIFLGFTIIGVFGQIVGFFIIFRSFLPDFYDYICRLPVVGHYLSIISKYVESYRVQNALDKLAGNNRI